VEPQSKKVELLKIKDFEKARLANGTDEGCIFVDYPHIPVLNEDITLVF
jgi:hypothetical protein